MRLAWIAVVTALGLLSFVPSPAGAQSAAPPGKTSDRVSYVGFLPEPGVISARFKDGLMYVSTVRGLAIYDVKDAAAPKKVGELALPNFENEDIDVGNGIALISNDPSEGLGRLHVIDVKDPAAPKLLTSYDTGTIFDSTFDGVFGDPVGKGTGHTASCLQGCKYVWLAGTAAGIDIVDLRVPSAPVYVKRFPATEATGGLATHDVQFDQAGRAWVAGAGGTVAYDVTDPVNPKLAFRTDQTGDSIYDETFGADDGSAYNNFIHHNSMRLRNSSLGALPIGADPAADSDVVAITEEDYNRPTCAGAGSFETWRIDAALLHPLDKWDVEVDPNRQTLCSAHYFDERGGLVAQGWYEQGIRFLDVSDPRDIRQVGYFIPQKTLAWGALYVPTDPSGEIVYGLDNLRGIDVLRFDRPDPPPVPEPGRNPESSSLQTLPTVVAPPSDPPAGGSSSGGAASSSVPNVALTVANGVRSARRGQKLRWRLRVRHLAGPAARGVVVRVDVPKVVTRSKPAGRRVEFRVGELAPGASKTFTLTATVRRKPRAKAVLLISSVRADEDLNPRDNRAVDRDPIKRRASRRARAASSSSAEPGIAALAGDEPSSASPAERRRAAADHALATRNRELITLSGPRVAARRVEAAVRSAYGWVCRLAAVSDSR